MTKFFLGEHSGVLTDLYGLTMAAGYSQTGFEARATFEVFVRRLPSQRNYLVAAGLEQALDFLENIRFSADEIAYLRNQPAFRHVRPDFYDRLARFRFTGDVWALPEGTVVFAGEPILRVTAAIAEGQILETRLLATINFQTMVASRAARVVTAARDRPVIEFGARRAHGTQAGVLAARAAWIGGCEGTSNVMAGHRFGIPIYGTQAHSWIMAHESEAEAFQSFLDVFPEHSVLLLDTYDVHAALRKIISRGRKPAGVRLDSGDLARDSRWVRQQLDRAGWHGVKIFASGDLDEKKIAALLRRGGQIDSFGVGSALVAPTDAPNLGMIYKLVELERGGRVREAAKLSAAKATFPGRKQIYRFSQASGKWQGDVIALADEKIPGGQPLLVEVMRQGKRTLPPEPLAAARGRCLKNLEHLPARCQQLHRSAAYPVQHSTRLKAMLSEIRRRVRRSNSRHAG